MSSSMDMSAAREAVRAAPRAPVRGLALFLLQRCGKHLGEVHDLAPADFADDQRGEKLPVDGIGLLAADDQGSPHRLAALPGRAVQDLAGPNAADAPRGLRHETE